jgi:hypothetical protein
VRVSATPAADVPFLDEHATSVAAGVDDVWRSLLDTLDKSFSRTGVGTYVRLVGSPDHAASGPRPLAPGSTMPGFRVAAAAPGRELVLEGRHHFSTYALTFRLEPVDAARTELRAESRATFPGAPGRLYRTLVVSTGGHVRAVRSLLATIRRDAERR